MDNFDHVFEFERGEDELKRIFKNSECCAQRFTSVNNPRLFTANESSVEFLTGNLNYDRSFGQLGIFSIHKNHFECQKRS